MDNYVVSYYVPYVPPEPQIGSYRADSCVSYVRYRRPDLDESWGTPKAYAQTHPLAHHPFQGAVVITKESRPNTDTWHAAYVERIEGTNLILTEANYLGAFVSSRSLPVESQLIAGYL